MLPLRQPGWLRGLEVAAGLIALVSAVFVLADPGLGVATLVIILSVGLILAGIRSLSLWGYGGMARTHRTLSAVWGVLAIIFGIIVAIFPGLALLTLIELFAIGLLIYGVGRLSLAMSLKATSSGARGLIVVVGVLDIILSVAVLALPGVALLTLAFLLGVGLLFIGVEMLISGINGRTWLGQVVNEAEKKMP
ncbi:MAG: DUF308 domain-containing protein [Thaumarchaeota archaeon]|nr:DUF308 domain-containing protein [Nitrososphaerota archaeon]